MEAGLGDFARGIKARCVRAAVEVHHDSATGVVLRRNDGDRLLGDVDAEAEQFFVDVWEVPAHEIRVAVRDVEVDEVEAEPLDLMVDGASDDVARGKLGTLVEAGMKRSPVSGSFSCPPSHAPPL